jgi:nicotinate phosphoribosyltransferase
VPERASGLITDLYALTMAESYLREGVTGRATFSLFVRRLPPERGYLVAAGLNRLVEFVQAWRFEAADLAFLRGLGMFSEDLLAYLGDARFEGELRAVPEGRAVFADEPLLEVSAPIIIGQLLEAATINLIQLPTLQASKAARCVEAAAGRPVADFSLRRTHGLEAGLTAARTGYLAGMTSTSDVLAGAQLGIPLSGTMAHAFVGALGDEERAFRAFAGAFPDGTTLLIDTYDTLEGARKAIAVGQALRAAGHRLRSVRIDSGDYVGLSKEVRRMLDAAGLQDVGIFISGGLDEYAIADLLAAGAPVDGFGVGTTFGCAADAPYLEIAYKLVEYAGRPILKLSTGKESWVGPKQVWRRSDHAGLYAGDTLGLAGEDLEGEPLIEPVLEAGQLVRPLLSLAEARDRWAAERDRLPAAVHRLRDPAAYPVTPSAGLEHLQAASKAELRGRA